MIRDEVIKAITFQGPQYVPLRIYDDPDRSDIIETVFDPPAGWEAPKEGQTEWGFAWEHLDQTMGQVKKPAFQTYEEWEAFTKPDPTAPGRFRTFEAMARRYPDKYLIGTLDVSGFNRTTFLLGMDRVFIDLYRDVENYKRVLSGVAEFEKEIIKGFARAGANAIAFYDDWGTQHSLMVDPQIWREVFRPVYREQFELIHQLGMHVFFHSCGKVNPIIGDLIEIGADMLNFNQIHLLGLEDVARQFAGKACFFLPCDNQRIMPTGDLELIAREARRLVDLFGSYDGGFIGQAERYASMGFSEAAFETCIQTFRAYGREKYVCGVR